MKINLLKLIEADRIDEITDVLQPLCKLAGELIELVPDRSKRTEYRIFIAKVQSTLAFIDSITGGDDDEAESLSRARIKGAITLPVGDPGWDNKLVENEDPDWPEPAPSPNEEEAYPDNN